MKKILTRTLTLVIALVLAIGAFSGCGLITTDTERDLNQTVATVDIGDVHTDYITKREIVAGYMSYGYYYVQSYGYTLSKAYATVLERLVQSTVIVQQAKVELGKYFMNKDNSETEFGKYFFENIKGKDAKSAEELFNGGVSEAEYKKASESGDYAKLASYLERYLTEYELAQAKYNVRKNIDSMIDSFVTDENDDEDEKEDETFTARAVPSKDEHTHDSDQEFNLKDKTPEDYDYKVAAATLGNEADWKAFQTQYKNEYDLNKHVYDNYTIDLSTTERKNGLSKAIKQLKKNGLIKDGENYSLEDKTGEDKGVLEYSYFRYMLKSQYESLIVSKYEKSLEAEVESKLGDKALKDQFIAEYNAQEQSYLSDYTAYETALEAATETSEVYCNPEFDFIDDNNKYGYVLNLLIGFNDEQTALLKELNSKAGISNKDKLKNREEMLKYLVAKDQRTTWVQSSYGTQGKDADDKFTTEFTFDDKYLLSDVAALKSYLGTAILAKELTDKDDSGVTTTKYSFENVYANGISYADFEENYLSLATLTKFEKKDGSEVRQLTENLEENVKIFKDLMYAFSTDTGCLGKDFGYLYSPKTSAKKYVPEFAEAAKNVVAKGAGAYTVVATDYGYHVILCTKQVENKNGEASNIYDALVKDNKEYNETKRDSILSDYVSKISNKMINQYVENNVKYVKDAYSDIITNDDDPSAKNN